MQYILKNQQSFFRTLLLPLGLVVGVAAGVLGEPATEDTALLMEHFEDAPETAEGEAGDDDGDGVVGDEQRGGAEQQGGDEPYPPGATAPVIFHFDYERMANAYAEEYAGAYYYAVKIHMVNKLFNPHGVGGINLGDEHQGDQQEQHYGSIC